jgi:hypothetical protein
MSSMICVEDPINFRKNIKSTLEKLVENTSIASNLEIGVFNYSLEHAHKLNVVKLWSNQYFVQIYTDRLRSIYLNLKRNKDLLQKLK